MRDADIHELMAARFKMGGRGNGYFDCWGLYNACLEKDGKPRPKYTTPDTRGQMANLIAGELAHTWRRCAPQAGAMVALKFPTRKYGELLHVGYLNCPENTGGSNT